MNVFSHPTHAGLLVAFDGEPEHEHVLQRMARRAANGRWVTVFRMETTSILKRLGYTPPSLFDHYRMAGKYTPFKHQRVTTKFLIDTYRGWCLNGMRSGKTSSTAWAMDALLSFGEIKRVLILSPLSIMQTSWERELFYANPQLRVYVGNRAIKRVLKDCDASMPQVLVLNHDKLSHIPNWLHQEFNPDLVVIDEATGFKDETSNRYMALEKLMSVKRRLWLLTGTPVTQSPLDVWALSRFVNPHTPRSKVTWRQQTMMQSARGKLIPLKDANDKVAALLAPAIRFATQDCIDMPAQTYHHVEVPLTPQQKKSYSEMVRTMRTEYNGQSVTAVNAAVQVFKLLQIAAGIVRDNDGNAVVIGAKPRVAECKRLIEQAEGKVIIISPFTEVQNYIEDELKKHFTTCVVNGSVTGRRRTDMFDSFQSPDGPQVMIAHPAVIQYGLTLSAASMSIWWTGTYRTEHFIQANERMRGPDTHKTGVYMLEGTAAERKVYRTVQGNSDMNDAIVDIFRDALNDTE